MKRVYGSHQIEEAIRPYISKKDWAILDCRIDSFGIHQTLYDSKEGEKVALMLEQLISKLIEEMGGSEDILGSESVDHFVIITSEVIAPRMKEALKARFDSEVSAYYSTLNKEHGYLISGDNEKTEFMHLSVGMVLSSGVQRKSLGDILDQ